MIRTSTLLCLSLLLPLLPACGDDDSDAGSSAEAGSNERPDTGSESDSTAATDTSDRPAAPEVPADFEGAWALYYDALLDYSVAEACPCFISLGFESSVESCRGTINEQLANQASCYRFALQSNEGAARGFISCQLTNYQPAIACHEALTESAGCGDSPCPLDEGLLEDCKLLLGAEQRSSYEACAPEEEE